MGRFERDRSSGGSRDWPQAGGYNIRLLLNACPDSAPLSLMSSARFEMTVSVLPGDIDEQNHVNNTVYLRWVQEVATAHWQAIASSEAQEGIGWVVLRHEIDYKTAACLGDDIVLRTWVGKATRLTFERFTEIRRNSDDQLLSAARTLWCPINAQTGRPVRVSAEVREQFSV